MKGGAYAVKKQSVSILLALVFVCFCAGLFLGRNLPRAVEPPLVPSAVPQNVTQVDINQADEQTLMTLPGIGPVLAQQIVLERETGGDFSSPAELLRVRGIGSERLEALLPYITTGG